MARGRASSRIGRRTVRTPFLYSAAIFPASTVGGSEKLRLKVPPTVDAGKIAAEYKNGVLTVRLPMREEARPRAIDVQVG